ncbi:FecR family protein [Echinicola rosea]|uniref:Anti-sigma factor n=1 Tax=Echinicola rosea TaxID=1807691 RepID=A0ABQ1V0B6_9BACT|nr:FecR domain-containing protein [Echinicola rosea]GGF29840.1 anti-sigma factor [Echinicola rosea]
MNREEINKLLDKFLSGEISPEEQKALDRWYKDFDGEDDVTDGMRAEEQWDLRSRMLGGIRQEAFDNIEHAKAPSTLTLRKLVMVAATLIMVVTLGFLFYRQQTQPVVYRTDLGEVLILKLPDSTEVTLNGNSEISYTSSWFGGFDRKVLLKGEAFFDVVHTIDDRRFTINEASGMGVEVFGTAFNYSVREGVNAVALQTGSVKITLPEEVAEKRKFHFLKPGEFAVYDHQSKEVAINTPANIERYYAWKEGKLILDYSTLPEIIDKIKGTYGLKISMDTTNWKAHKVSGTLPLTRDPESLIKNLEQLFDVEIKITNRE